LIGAWFGAAAAGALSLLLVVVDSPVEVTASVEDTVDEADGVPAGAASSVAVVSVVAVTVSVAAVSVVAVTASDGAASAVEVVSVVVVTASVGLTLSVAVVSVVEVTDSVLVTSLLEAGASAAGVSATVGAACATVGTAVAVGGTGVGVGSLPPHAARSRHVTDKDTRMPIDLRMVEPFFLVSS
jgi:hypothetical protein